MAVAISDRQVSAVAATTNDATASLLVREGHLIAISIIDLGSFSGTIALQRRFNAEDDTDWRTWKTWTAAAEDQIMSGVDCECRLIGTTMSAGSVELELRSSRERYV